MKWAKFDEIEGEIKILYMVLSWVVAPYPDMPIDHHLRRVLGDENGFGGDPGWEIEKKNDDGKEYFLVWADKEVTCFDEEEFVFGEDEFYRVLKETLLAYAVAHPLQADEVSEVIKKYNVN